MSVGFPSASIPFAIIFSCCPVTSYVRVSLFGGGPGLSFDFPRFSSHVPAKGSLVCADRLTMDRVAVARIKPRAAVRQCDDMAFLHMVSANPLWFACAQHHRLQLARYSTEARGR